MKKIVTIVGARPQFVKAATVSVQLAEAEISECLVHTGQHYDQNMSGSIFECLNIRNPDYQLSFGGLSHGAMTGRMLEELESILMTEAPSAVIVYGDTNSTLAGALAASKLHIPLIHIEAGLRSYNRLMPEELNRLVTDHLANLLLCSSSAGVDNLRKEGIVDNVYDVGDVMADVCLATSDAISPETCRALLSEHFDTDQAGKYWLMTCHRAENVDHPERISEILGAIREFEGKVVFPLHPRTAARVRAANVEIPRNIIVMDPVDYHTMIALIMGSCGVLTDSGGLQKESYWLKKRCITLREETEWIETVSCGWNRLVGCKRSEIVNALRSFEEPDYHHALYGDGKASSRSVKIIDRYISDTQLFSTSR